MSEEIKYTIQGDPRTKKNSLMIAGKGRRCPACGDIMDSVEQCPYCGQRVLPDDTVRERKKVSRMACLLCGTEHALVITRGAYNGHIRGVCEACGAKMMG